MIDRNKSWCYNCNELGHFVTECKKHRQARDRKESYKKKESYDGLKKKNAKLKQKLDAMVVKYKGRAYIVEDESWDDTDSENEED